MGFLRKVLGGEDESPDVAAEQQEEEEAVQPYGNQAAQDALEDQEGAAYLRGLLSYSAFDWNVTSREANKAARALARMEILSRRNLISELGDELMGRLVDNLDPSLKTGRAGLMVALGLPWGSDSDALLDQVAIPTWEELGKTASFNQTDAFEGLARTRGSNHVPPSFEAIVRGMDRRTRRLYTAQFDGMFDGAAVKWAQPTEEHQRDIVDGVVQCSRDEQLVKYLYERRFDSNVDEEDIASVRARYLSHASLDEPIEGLTD